MSAPFREADGYHIEKTGRGFAIWHDWHGTVLEDIDCLQDARWHVEELEERDREAAEAEARELAEDDLAPVLSFPATYTITRAHHGFYEVRDLGGEVASAKFDHHDFAWVIVANTDRYQSFDELPAVFGGRFVNSVARFGDLFRFFGCPLPGAAEIARAKDEAA